MIADFITCSLCPSGTLCYSVGRNISCDCPLSHDKCSLLSSCEEFCVNGSCNTFECSCLPGFSGINCDVQLCNDQVCNGNSVCSMVNGTYKCQCLLGFIGELCDQGKLSSFSSDSACQNTVLSVMCMCLKAHVQI